MVWWPGDRIPSESGVRREVREREKIRGGGEGERRERVSSLPLPTYPTPYCFFCSHLFAPSHNLNAWKQAGTFTM